VPMSCMPDMTPTSLAANYIFYNSCKCLTAYILFSWLHWTRKNWQAWLWAFDYL